MANEARRDGKNTQIGVPAGELCNLWKRCMRNYISGQSVNPKGVAHFIVRILWIIPDTYGLRSLIIKVGGERSPPFVAGTRR